MMGIESCVVCVVPFFEDYVDYGLSVWGESSGVGVANYFDGWGGGVWIKVFICFGCL